jgi:hypothetical protein
MGGGNRRMRDQGGVMSHGTRAGAATAARRAAAAAFAATMALIAPASTAAPCAGFTDVDSTSPFCPNVEWIKNRSVTLGCSSATLYCPDSTVSRLAMAAFMNRLGAALTPVQVRVDDVTGTIDLDVDPVVCQTADFAVTDFPRRAYLDVTMSLISAFDVNFAADLAYSTNAGATWTNVNTITNRSSVVANRWNGASDIGYLDLAVGQDIRWGVRMSRGGVPGTADIADSRCQLRALIHSRDGSFSPY